METTIYALTDSHQECRNLSKLFSGIYNFEKNNETPFILLDCGDLFKGIYDKNLSVNAYLKLKQLLPQAQIFITLGNNDFGFNKFEFEYLKNTIKSFKKSGINVVCANVIDNQTNDFAQFVERYKVVSLNGKKFLITGFCINNSCAKNFGLNLIPPQEAFENLVKTVKEPYDKIIVLNHHWYSYSNDLKEFSKKINFPIDLIIGGHEHSPIKPDYKNNIFYPLAFARTLYKIAFDEQINAIDEIPLDKIKFISEFETPIVEYETETKLKQPIIKRVLNLTKKYSDPCPLGTFISDNMMLVGETDIAFHSTGFTMYCLCLDDSDVITRYDIERVICAPTVIEKIELNTDELKKVFKNALLYRAYRDRGNSRFLQCSQNISIRCHQNSDKTYKILQITINGENLLDLNAEPIDKNRKISCTIDHYIGSGEQGFEILKDKPKTKILNEGKEIPLNELFYNALITAEKNFNGDSEYPSFELIEA